MKYLFSQKYFWFLMAEILAKASKSLLISYYESRNDCQGYDCRYLFVCNRVCAMNFLFIDWKEPLFDGSSQINYMFAMLYIANIVQSNNILILLAWFSLAIIFRTVIIKYSIIFTLYINSKNLDIVSIIHMAFVFKSQNSAHNIYPIKQQSSPSVNHAQQFNSKLSQAVHELAQSQSSKIVKGLPSLLNKSKFNQHQQSESSLKNKLIFKTTSKENKQIVNVHKLKKQSKNYFFVSTSPRNPYGDILKPIDKNLTCQQFKANSNQQKKPLSLAQTLQKFPSLVNRNLRSTATQLCYEFKKSTIPNNQKIQNIETMIITNDRSLKKQVLNNNKIKQNIKSYQVNKSANKIDQRKTCSIRRQISQDKKQKHPICMMTSAQILKDKDIQESKQSTKKCFNLKKGPLQASFYKNQSSQQEQEETEYSKNCTPGPGAYNQVSLQKKKNFRSKKQKFSKIFITPLERFSKSNINFHQITYVNQQDQVKTLINKRTAPFLSKAPKFQQIQNMQIPCPGQYNTRQSMEHEIVRKLLINANTANFSSSAPRFKYKNIDQNQPGPGDYNIDVVHQIRSQQIRAQMSYFYKSKVNRCSNNSVLQKSCSLTEQNLELLNNSNSKIIHKHQQSFSKDQFFTAPPFMSSQQRFSSLNKLQDNIDRCFENIPNISPTKKQQKQIMVNRTPFNSSAKRQVSGLIGQGVGVGSYNVQKCKWYKKSYNVNFH